MRVLLALAFSLLATCHARGGSSSGERRATLLVTSDVWGYLEPCGCSKNMRGGIDRTAAYVAKVRSEGPTLLVDAGDALFDRTSYQPAEQAQALEKARTVAAALGAMDLSAKAMFERDRVMPEAVAALPRKALLDGPAVREVGGMEIGLVPVDATKGDAAAALAKGAAEVRDDGASVVVALVHAPRAQVIQLAAAAQAAGVDVIVGAHIDTEQDGEKARLAAAAVPVIFTQARGQSVLRLDLVLRGGGRPVLAEGQQARDAEVAAVDERIASMRERIAALPAGTDPAPFQAKVKELEERRRKLAEEPPQLPATGSYLLARFVPMTDDRPSDAKVRGMIEAYDRKISEINLAYAAQHGGNCPQVVPDQPFYVGSAACIGCHPASQDTWLKTAHARAYETLEQKQKQHDLTCIGCHVTGWEKAGGACRIDAVAGREDVTCENCHGPGSPHLIKPVKETMPPVPEATCRGCHTPEHSLNFDPQRYRALILGPGHGMPPLPGQIVSVTPEAAAPAPQPAAAPAP